MRVPKLKSASKLALFSTAMMIVAITVLYFSVSTSFNEKVRKIEQDVLDGGIKYITTQIADEIPFNDINYPGVNFSVLDEDGNVVFDGLGEWGSSGNEKTFVIQIHDRQYEIKVDCHIASADRDRQGVFMIIIPLSLIALISFVISSLLVDKILNPVRVMIKKVKVLAEKNFDSKIFIDSAEDELREYAIAFNDMSSKINEYIEKQKQFISDASHELVTPITVIVGHTDMLIRWAKDDKDLLDSELQIIKNEALSMNELIENLLFFARTDNKKIKYTMGEIDLSNFLNDCVVEQRLLHPDFEIMFSLTAPVSILADIDALRQVVRIIFSNSVKYSHQKKEISVCAEIHNQSVSIFMSDKGIGMKLEHLSRIFDRFYRIDDSRMKETGGTGLGLAIAKEIIHAHDGQISATSELAMGTTITIAIPIKV